MEFKKQLSLDKSGQSSVEYIILLGMVVLLTLSILNNDYVQNFIGKDAAIFAQFSKYYQYSFRYPLPGSNDTGVDYSDSHDSYVNPDSGKTRFFTYGQEGYP